MAKPIILLLSAAVLLASCATTETGDLTPRVDTKPHQRKMQISGAAKKAEQPSREQLFKGTDRQIDMPPARPKVALHGDAVSLNFEQAPMVDVVHAILGDILQVDYVVEHPIRGEVTLRTRSPVPRDQLLPILESLLQSNGALMVRDPHDRYFVSASKNLPNMLPQFSNPKTEGAGYTNVIIPLQHISAGEMAEILKPVAPGSAFVRVDGKRNLLVLAGTRYQVDGWLDIVNTFDVDQLAGMSVAIFPLDNTAVKDVEAALGHLLGDKGDKESSLAGLVRIIPIERLNSILVVSPRASYLDTIRNWIDRLDQVVEDPANEPTLHVYAVQNGNATQLADLLSRIFGGGGGAAGGGKKPQDSGVAPGLTQMSTGSGMSSGGSGSTKMPDSSASVASSAGFGIGDHTRVVADDYNNALLVYAPAREYTKIKSALEKLDVVPAQVLIEASILEVTLTDELKYGVEWAIENSIGDSTGTALLSSTNSAAIGAQVPGFSYTVTNSAGVVRAAINALADKSLVNVISTPSVLVLDNHTAAIHVGDQQPTQSSQTITDGGNISTSIQYKDTGVKLEVTPSVNAGDLVTMDILQSVTDVGTVDTATKQRSFLERNVSSRVAVRSGESVVLGGLIRDNKSRGRIGVPFLQDIPVLGPLFGTRSENTTRTELLVFITPRVLKDEQQLRDISQEMRERMRGLKHFEDLPQAGRLPARAPLGNVKR